MARLTSAVLDLQDMLRNGRYTYEQVRDAQIKSAREPDDPNDRALFPSLGHVFELNDSQFRERKVPAMFLVVNDYDPKLLETSSDMIIVPVDGNTSMIRDDDVLLPGQKLIARPYLPERVGRAQILNHSVQVCRTGLNSYRELHKCPVRKARYVAMKVLATGEHKTIQRIQTARSSPNKISDEYIQFLVAVHDHALEYVNWLRERRN